MQQLPPPFVREPFEAYAARSRPPLARESAIREVAMQIQIPLDQQFSLSAEARASGGMASQKFYTDGPRPSASQEVERAYRESFLAGAREAARLTDPAYESDDYNLADAREAAGEARWQARLNAQIVLDDERIVYRVGHELDLNQA